MYRYGPGHTEGKLRICAQFLLFYFLFLIVESIAYIAPDGALYIQFTAIFGDDKYAVMFFFVEADYRTKCAVYPAMFNIVAHKQYLCTCF